MIYHTLRLEGLSIRKIAEVTGTSRNAVRRALRSERAPDGKRCRIQGEKLGPYMEQINAWLRDPVRSNWTAARIYDEIEQRGYTGGITVLNDFVRKHRRPKNNEAECRFYVKPGQQMQVDWGEMIDTNSAGERRKVYVFIAVLAWSRHTFIRFTDSMDLLHWLDCHTKAFSFFGGVPEEVLIDNLKTGVESRAGKTIRWNDRFAELSNAFGFRPIAHFPRRPKTKGRVERLVMFVRERFFLGRPWLSLDTLNAEALDWLERRANKRIHRITRVAPANRFEHEKTFLKPLTSFDVMLEEPRVVDAYGLISIDGVRYSAPSKYARRSVSVQRRINSIRVLAEGKEIAQHVRAKRGVRVVQLREHLPPKPLPTHDRFMELRAGLVDRLGHVGAEYVQRIEERAPHSPLALLREVVETADLFGDDLIRRSLTTLLEYGVIKRGKLAELCYRYGGTPALQFNAIAPPSDLDVERRSLNVYDEVTQ